jgi:hypothetical protein
MVVSAEFSGQALKLFSEIVWSLEVIQGHRFDGRVDFTLTDSDYCIAENALARRPEKTSGSAFLSLSFFIFCAAAISQSETPKLHHFWCFPASCCCRAS